MQFAGLALTVALAVGVVAVVFQFLVTPFILDFTLGTFFKLQWVAPGELPEHLRQFLERFSQQRGLKFPHFGIINDGTPQAFTYGHIPGNARIVITRGILELLDDKEIEAVAHELGHALHWDMALITAAQLIPLVLYVFFPAIPRLWLSKTRSAPENIQGAVRWDLWNPWARWYELNSTHPLVANRLRYLSDQARNLQQPPYLVLDKAQPQPNLPVMYSSVFFRAGLVKIWGVGPNSTMRP